jgi:NAD(P)-dependent dehydrogenase (short-subunit alcohol dehydrogenase family)
MECVAMGSDNGKHDGGERRAIFISGAGAGIGRTTAELFASRGWFVGLYDIDTAAVAAARAEIGGDGAIDGHLDVTAPASWTAALAGFWKASAQRLDILFNNAGIIAPGPFAEVDLAAHQKVLDVNVSGVINGSHAAHTYLRRTPGARVINMASASAIYGQPDIAVYSASKFAVRGLTEALDLEWRKNGIRVSAIWPLWVKTALADAAGTSRTTTSLGVRLKPADVAEVVWRAATEQRRLHRTHWHVGLQTNVLNAASHFGPSIATREVTGLLSGT